VVALLVVLGVLVFGYQAWRAGSALIGVEDQGRQLSSELDAGNLAAARSTVRALQRNTSTAHAHTDGFLWDLASHLPVLGRNVDAVQRSAAALDSIATDSLPTLLRLGDEVSSGDLRPRHGRVDLAALRRVAPEVIAAAAAVDGPAADLARVRPDGLVFPLGSMVRELQSRVADAKAAVDATRDAVTFLPGMLGADGPRSYLLLIQNPAELRSTGGIPGSWAILHAQDGRLRMGAQGSGGDLSAVTPPPVRLAPDVRALYGTALGEDLRDITIDPDFPDVARLARGLARAHGHRVDGVFAVDPVALARVLQGTGSVDIGDGIALDAGNAVPVLLNGIYRTVQDPGEQNHLYAVAARKVFDALVQGQGNQVLAIRGLVRAAQQDRVLAWSDEPSVSRAIAGHDLAGGLSGAGTNPTVGVYLSDAMGGKMGYYLRQASVVSSSGCTDTGAQRLELTTTLRSVTPPDIASYSPYVVGLGNVVPQGHLLLKVRVYSPWQGRLERITVDGRDEGGPTASHAGHQVGVVTVDLPPDGVVTVRTALTTGPGQSGDPEVVSTPGMETARDPATFPSACG
jgi:hypothetical protein